MSNPVITIITPTLNAELTIEKCIGSVNSQTYRNVEHLIIDGLSSDRTVELVKNYQIQWPHIRLLTESDSGIYYAMNKGIKYAKGDWVYFLGGDDAFINKHVLSVIFNENDLGEYDVVYGNVLSKQFGGRYDGEFTVEKIIHQNICQQAIFFRKKLFNRLGTFNTEYQILADWDFNIKWFFKKKIRRKYLGIDIAEYNETGLSSRYSDEKFLSEKQTNLIKYGLLTLPSKILYHLTLDEFQKAKLANQLLRAFLFRTINFFASIRLKLDL
jgi:glycosyltransferase involved in cell wall biosynthesis